MSCNHFCSPLSTLNSFLFVSFERKLYFGEGRRRGPNKPCVQMRGCPSVNLQTWIHDTEVCLFCGSSPADLGEVGRPDGQVNHPFGGEGRHTSRATSRVFRRGWHHGGGHPSLRDHPRVPVMIPSVPDLPSFPTRSIEEKQVAVGFQLSCHTGSLLPPPLSTPPLHVHRLPAFRVLVQA